MATSKPPDKPAAPFEQDPQVERLRPDPSAAPLAAVTLEGLAGRSDRDGRVRLYFNTALNYFAEFAAADILFSEAIPADQAPFRGHKATRVGVRQDAVIDYTRTVAAKAADPFALDVRRGASRRSLAPNVPDSFFDCPATIGIECPTQPFGCATDQTCGCGTGRTDCVCPTDNTCRTDCGATCDTCVTCDTCNTQCEQATCNTCGTNCGTCNTCATNCGTCNTCATQCNQATCNTCRTDCGGRTCVTCDTCNPHVFTCGNQRGCQF